MSIINDILNILDVKGLKQADLCNALQINTSTMTNWKKRNTDPPAKFIIPICEFLDVSPYYLLTGKEKSTPSDLTENAQIIVDLFEDLSETQQGELIGRAKVMIEQNANIHKQEEIG